MKIEKWIKTQEEIARCMDERARIAYLCMVYKSAIERLLNDRKEQEDD
jgi:hypothetical protein